MRDLEKQPKINMLMPIDNIFGKHEGRLGPVLLYIIVVSLPVLFYAFMLQLIMPFKLFLVIELLFAFRMALIILGNEKNVRKHYRESKKNKYASAYDLVHIAHAYRDTGLIEYQNGSVKYMLVGYTQSYMNDNTYELDMQRFMEALEDYEYDLYCQLVTGEYSLLYNSEALRVYEDKDFMKERLEFYRDQDKFVEQNSKLYRYVFLVKGSKYSWKEMGEKLNALCESSWAKVFKTIYIAKGDEIDEISSRDLGTHISISEMLRRKYVNDDYDGSKVLFFGDAPDEYLQKGGSSDNIEDRRVVFKNEEEV